MSSRREGLWIGLATLLGLYLAFIQYLPPVRSYHLVGDIDGYHHPLVNYAFTSLKEGRFPLWDPGIYCGLSFPANIQAQLFYPPTWILFAAQWRRVGVTFMALQIFTIAHIWIMLQFAYWWLRKGRELPSAAALIGATVFCFSGYVINDLQHIGVICAIAWLPLALWGVDRRRVWMIALAMALTFLAGYPATWIACALAVLVYAAATAWKFTPRALVGILFSLALAAIQLLPSLQLAALRPGERVYGTGPNLEWQLRRFYPSSLHDPNIYLYYGAGLLLAFVLFFWKIRSANWRAYAAPFALGLAGTIFFQDPYHVVSVWAEKLGSLVDVMQHWNFHIVLSAAAGLFTALAWAPVAAGSRRTTRVLFAVVLPMLWFEQYWFGMRRDEHFGAPGNTDKFFKDDVRNGGPSIAGFDPSAYRAMKSDPAYRIVTDHGPHATELRHYRIPTPLGFDPFLTSRYKQEIERLTTFTNNREFELPPGNEAMLKLLAVRYYASAEGRQYYEELVHSPLYRKLPQENDTYFKVFEYLGAQPSWRFESGSAAVVRWTPEIREFQVSARQPGEFVLIEQFLPGWSATVDEKPVAIGFFSTAFQKIQIPAGAHRIRFQYRSEWLPYGALLSGVSLVLLAMVLRRDLC